MENMKVDRDDLPVPHKVVIPARFAVLERLLHLAVAIFNQVHIWTSLHLLFLFLFLLGVPHQHIHCSNS